MSEASSGSASPPDPRLYSQQPANAMPPQQPVPPQPAPQPVQPPQPYQQPVPPPQQIPQQQPYPAPGYGYPQQPAQQQMYAQQPTQPAQPTPAPGGGGIGSQEPDWASMADDYERTGKRKRTMIISGALVAGLAVIGGVVWFGLSGSKSRPDAGPSTKPTPVASTSSAPVTPSPTPSATHTPPLAPADIFAKTTLTVDGKTFTRTADDNTDPCWKASMDGLGSVLTKNGCAQVLRGTYASGNHAVTVAVVVFHSKSDAQAAASAFTGKVTPLYGGNVDSFCVGKAGCQVTHAVSDHFLYIAESGLTGASASKPDALSDAAGHAASSYVLSSLLKIEQNS